jgi:hypothetical protein
MERYIISVSDGSCADVVQSYLFSRLGFEAAASQLAPTICRPWQSQPWKLNRRVGAVVESNVRKGAEVKCAECSTMSNSSASGQWSERPADAHFSRFPPPS